MLITVNSAHNDHRCNAYSNRYTEISVSVERGNLPKEGLSQQKRGAKLAKRPIRGPKLGKEYPLSFPSGAGEPLNITILQVTKQRILTIISIPRVPLCATLNG
jgi:hypothetical protein